MENNLNIPTPAVHGGQNPDKWSPQCLAQPIMLTTTYKQMELQPSPEYYSYIGYNNPNRDSLEECLASVEKSKYALCFPSALCASTLIGFLLKFGDHLIITKEVYFSIKVLFEECFSNMNLSVSSVDMIDLEETKKHIKENTKMIWIETPTNPLLKLIDIKNTCELVRKRQPNCIIVVDNTFATIYYQRPLELGADIVVESLTKYMNGHTDVMMGAITTNNDEIYKRLKFCQIYMGVSPSPFDCYLVARGIKTFHLRMKSHMENGIKIARALEANPRVLRVLYPALPSHPQHDLYKQQMSGFSGIISFYIKGALENAKTFVKSLKIITLAESLGGVESTIKHPGINNYSTLSVDEREKLGVGDNFFRLSVGIENADDLIDDLYQALEAAID